MSAQSVGLYDHAAYLYVMFPGMPCLVPAAISAWYPARRFIPGNEGQYILRQLNISGLYVYSSAVWNGKRWVRNDFAGLLGNHFNAYEWEFCGLAAPVRDLTYPPVTH